ncbi:MAG: prepilin-type N-terminal cleavage/methylation domain-containing protein [Syntrophales bacterium]|nr:prepilin-type N-terminal cleavage/methylation domain-containing protein [Syntrophales bacterium]
MKTRGYTLIELVVVVAIASIMFFVAIPALRDAFFYDRMSKAIGLISRTVSDLALEAIRESVDFYLVCDLEHGSIYTLSHDMTPEKIDQQKKRSLYLPEEVKMRDVYLLGGDEYREGEVRIRFFSGGYAQPALIHLTEKDRVVTLFVEPFLRKIRVAYDDVSVNHFLSMKEHETR